MKVNLAIAWWLLKKSYRAINLLYTIYRLKNEHPEEFSRWINNVGCEPIITGPIRSLLKKFME